MKGWVRYWNERQHMLAYRRPFPILCSSLLFSSHNSLSGAHFLSSCSYSSTVTFELFLLLLEVLTSSAIRARFADSGCTDEKST